MKKPANKKRSRSSRAATKSQKRTEKSEKLAHTARNGRNKVSKTYASVAHKRRSKKDAKARKKAEYLATLPKSRIKRTLYRLHPKRVARYWFSKEGLIMALKLTGIGFALMIVFILGLFAYFRRDLPDPRDISSRRLNQSTKFYDRTGEHLLFEVYGDENRTVVEFDQISDYAKWATVAVEDKDFYEHGGVSFSGIMRAAWSNFRTGDATGQGGSTITQQFIKNSLLTTDQTYTRKVQEIILAIELERLYTKDEILSFYLNEIPYGPQEYGIEAAAQSFFGKSAKDLGLAEAAMLAALPQAPTLYSPYGDNKDLLKERMDIIIDLMNEQGYITDEQAEKAKEVDIFKRITPIDQRSLYAGIIAPHFVIEVQQQLEELFSANVVQNGGLKVITTLDKDFQEIAEKAVKDNDGGDGFCDRQGLCGDNAAFVMTDVETGQVLAMVGSRGFNYPEYGSFNAALADRQPGSSFKPFDYAQLFYNDRWGPDSYIYDVNTTWGSYAPKNFDFGYRGRMLVRQALGESRNIPAVKAADIAGIDAVANLAIDMGNQSLADDPSFDLSYSLGAGEVKLAEHAHAYATFARGGKYVPQSYIISVENTDGDKLLEWEESEGEQVLDEQIAYLMTDILKDDAARSGTFGLGNSNLVVPGVNHTVKTGTTDSSVDGWMMGYTKHYSFGTWVGNHDNAPMGAALTSHQTGPIFTQVIREVYQKRTDLDPQAEILARPDGIKNVKMDRDTGYAATDKSKNTYVGIFPSWYQPETSDEQNKYVIDKVTGKKATECTPERAREEKTGGGLWPEVLPDDYRFVLWSKAAGYSSSGSGPTEEDDLHKCSDDLPNVSLDIDKINDSTYEFTADVSKGTHDLGTLNFKVNGQIVSSINLNKNGGTRSYIHTFNSDGNYTITAEVIDKALYDNSNSKQQSISGAGTSQDFEITSHSNGQTNVPTIDLFEWDSYPGANKYYFCYKKSANAGAPSCLDNNSDTEYGLSMDSGTEYEIYVRAHLGGNTLATSPTITITTN